MGQELTRGRSLESLRKEAKRWLKAINDHDPGARARLERALGKAPSDPALRDVQHALALEMGFAGWEALRKAVTEQPRAGSPSAAGIAALARYDEMADALLVAYRTGTPEAMARHYAHTWHRRAWPSMRTYVQLDLGKRPSDDGTDVEITADDARKLVALEYGFSDWHALQTFALSLPGTIADIAAKPVAVTIGDGKVRRMVEGTREWSAAIALLAGGQATGLDARGQMTDAVLEQLSRVPTIDNLQLGNSRAVTDDGLRHLAGLQRLRHLDLSTTAVTDRGLAALRDLPALESVNLSWTHVTDDGVAHLTSCERLKAVNLTGTLTGDGSLRALAGKDQLAFLRMGGQVTDAGLHVLHEYPVFRHWKGGESRVALLNHEQPNQLALGGAITDAGLAALRGLDGLFALHLDDQSLRITPRGLAPLASLAHLAWLAIAADDETMPYIAKLPRLRHLGCQDTECSDAGWVALSRSASIESIWGRRCHNLRTAGFMALGEMPALRSLSVSCLNVDDAGLAALPSFPALRELMPMDVRDEGYRHIARCTELDVLTLMYCRETGDRATEHITALPKLRKYFASYTKITDRTPALLAQIESLEEVELSGCPAITDVGVARLATLPRLREVSVSGQNVSVGVVDFFPPGVKVRWER